MEALVIILLAIHFCICQGLQWFPFARCLLGLQNRGTELQHYRHALVPTYELVLNILSTAPRVHGGLDIKWLELVNEPNQVLDMGLSSQLLFYIGEISIRASEGHCHDPDLCVSCDMLYHNIRELKQDVVGITDGRVQSVVEDIARSYQLAAMLLTLMRLYKYVCQPTPAICFSKDMIDELNGNIMLSYTLYHNEVQELVEELTQLLDQLPRPASPLYCVMSPMFSIILCSLVCSQDPAKLPANQLQQRTYSGRWVSWAPSLHSDWR